MQRSLLWLVVAVLSAVVVAASARPAHAAPATLAQLRDAILSLDDVGPAWELNEERPASSAGVVGYNASYTTRRAPIQLVSSDLTAIETSRLTVELEVGAALEAFRRRGFTSSRISFPSLGDSTLAYSLSGTLSGERVTGEVVGWEYAGVRATVLIFGTGSPRVQSFAQRQQEKLRAAFGPPATPPLTATPPTSPAPSSPTTAPATPAMVATDIVDCSSFTHQEAAQAVLLAYPGDPYHLDTDGNGMACEDLPYRSDGPPPPAAPTSSGPPSESQPSPPPPATADAPSGVIFEARGTGEVETDAFEARGRVEVCWEIRSTSTTTVAPRTSFWFYPEGSARTRSAGSLTGKETDGCSFLTLPPGRFYIWVNAVSFSQWRITIRPA